MGKILAIDDDEKILKLVKNALEFGGHNVVTVADSSLLKTADFMGYDMIILDVMMPNETGFDICRRIRESVECPILFLTAKTDESAVVEGLLKGGDDYIKKPFGIQELNARVSAHLRRESREKNRQRLVLDSIVIDFDKKKVFAFEKPLTLTKNEYKICEYLAINRGRTLTKQMIYEVVYDTDSDALFSTITEYIRTIRKKFKDEGLSPIDTVWGVGYIWK